MIDLDAFERDFRYLAEQIAGRPVKARPHAKTHKCPVIALKQVELGTVGVCVQKVSEAEAMFYGGVTGKQAAISFQHLRVSRQIGQIAGRRD